MSMHTPSPPGHIPISAVPPQQPGRRTHFDHAFSPGRRIAGRPITARRIIPIGRSATTPNVILAERARRCGCATRSHVVLAVPGFDPGSVPATSSLLMRTGTSEGTTRMNSLFRPKNSLFAQNKSLFCAEQGFGRSALELQRNWTPGSGERRQNGQNFAKFPVIFPVLWE